MGMVFTNHIANDTGRFLIGSVPGVVELMHGKEHSAVNRFQTISGIWERSSNDHTHGVIEITATHLLLKANGQCFFSELGH
jgi:hypothetical protein